MKIFVVGSINMDLVINAPYMPKNGETITGSDFMTNPGGKGANQAVAAAKLGGDVYMVGSVGDAFGDELKNTLKGYGVKTDYVKHSKGISSGIAVIVVVDRDNRIILDRASNGLVDKETIDKALLKAQKGDILICQLEIPLNMVEYAFSRAKELEMTTILNPAPAIALPNGLLKLTDFFIPNQSETEIYTGIYPDTIDKAKEATYKLNEMGVKHVIITLGSKGSCTLLDGEYVQIKSYSYLVNVIDTTAAGDTFIGAFATKMSEGWNIKDSMNYASKASALTISKVGAQKSIPTKEEMDNFKFE